jgi:hypothetical protein
LANNPKREIWSVFDVDILYDILYNIYTVKQERNYEMKTKTAKALDKLDKQYKSLKIVVGEKYWISFIID